MTEVERYINSLPDDKRKVLSCLRDDVQRLAPEAELGMGYGMPVFKYRGKYLIGLAAFKDHLSIFPGAGAIEAVKDQLGDFRTSKGTIQFTLEQPLPASILRTVVEHRMKDIDSAA